LKLINIKVISGLILKCSYNLNSYLAAAANGPYATYIPAGNTGQGGNAPNSIQLNPYAAAVAQESSRI